MPRRKTKTRSVFITKEPEWKTLKLLTDVAEREKAFKELEKIQKELEDAVRANPILEWTTEGFGGEDLKD